MAPTSRPLWGDLDALLRMPSPPVAPAIAVIDEARQRELRRRRLIRRLRRMSLAAGVGVVLPRGCGDRWAGSIRSPFTSGRFMPARWRHFSGVAR